jgi:hypothetical protein
LTFVALEFILKSVKANAQEHKIMAKRFHQFKKLLFGAKFQKESGSAVFVKLSPTQYAEITKNSTSDVLQQFDLEEKVTLVHTNFY